MTICIVGDSQDLASVYLSWLARRQGIEIIQLSEETLGVDWTYSFDDQKRSDGIIDYEGKIYRFAKLAGAFVRLHPQPDLPLDLELPEVEKIAFVSERRGAIQYFLNCLPCVVVNRPSGGRSNGSKSFQMQLLSKNGFEVPKWIVTNEKSVAEEFARKYGSAIIYKSCSGLRSRVRRLDNKLLERLSKGTSPVILQKYIKGKDVRVHVIRECIFATEIISHGIDYRFDNEGNHFVATSIPDSIAKLCRQVAMQEKLILAGFDFRIAQDGRWYCLEVNPVPNFLPYEMETGQPIGVTVLNLLIEGTTTNGQKRTLRL